MKSKRSFLKNLIALQIFWSVIITVIVGFLYIVVGRFLMSGYNYNINKPLSAFENWYFHDSGMFFLVFWIVLIITTGLYIQIREFKRYRSYFVSGLKYLTKKEDILADFHESLSKERQSFIDLHNYYENLEEEYKNTFREKTDLLTYLAHDLKTPLSNLLGYATLLYEEDLTQEQQKRFKKVIYENTNYLNHLTEDFFSYLKFNLNDIPLNINTINTKLFFNQWIEEREDSMTDNILKTNMSQIEDLNIKTDSELLLRVLDNLLSNAVKYSPDGTIIQLLVDQEDTKLKITMVNEVEEGVSLDINKLKIKFYRGDDSRNRQINDGSGLGLVIVNDIVKHLKGEFNIRKSGNQVFSEILLPIS